MPIQEKRSGWQSFQNDEEGIHILDEHDVIICVEVLHGKAPLLVAAPDMLEALIALVDSAHNGEEPGQTWVMVAGGLIDQAEAAIKKAQGGL
jgi:hypothetical protein